MKKITKIIKECGWTEYFEYAIKNIIATVVKKTLDMIKNNFDRPYLKKLHTYLDQVLIKWLNELVDSEKEREKWRNHTEDILLVEFVRLRTSEMFALF